MNGSKLLQSLFEKSLPDSADRAEIYQLVAEFQKMEQLVYTLTRWITPGADHPVFPFLQALDWDIPNLQPGVLLHRVTNQSITSPANAEFTVVKHDSHGFADLTANADRITIPKGLDGLYLAGGAMHVTTPTLNLHLYSYVSGSAVEIGDHTGSAGITSGSVAGAALMNAGDYFYLRATTSSSTLEGSSSIPMLFWATRVAPLRAGRK